MSARERILAVRPDWSVTSVTSASRSRSATGASRPPASETSFATSARAVRISVIAHVATLIAGMPPGLYGANLLPAA